MMDSPRLKKQEGQNDPNIRQQIASNPLESIWVSASAGTGKTKVLTDRVLRLLLPKSDGQAGSAPSRILCLTFTKAAANEMALRINKVLGQWAVMEEGKLFEKLLDLMGVPQTEEQLSCAKRLFAEVIDSPSGLQIMTIHSFCQSALGRFPLEADLPPNFEVLDEAGASQILAEAQLNVLKRAQNTDSNLTTAVQNLVSDLDQEAFSYLLRDICRERRQLESLLQEYNTVAGIYAALCTYYGVDEHAQETDAVRAFCADPACDEEALRFVSEAMLQDGSAGGPKRANAILKWLNAPIEERVQLYNDYSDVFLTEKGKGEIRSTRGFPAKKALAICPNGVEILQEEAQRVSQALEYARRIKSCLMTRDLLTIGQYVVEEYTAQKQFKGALDFDDLVLRTMALLTGKTNVFAGFSDDDLQNVAPWIMYKLDQGIDHILVDEAQDTNPEQWRIIEALCEEFFDGLSARDEVLRTSFTVGDIKQSIYSFQRAAPEEFQNMQGVFDQRITNSGQVNRIVSLDMSFRSTASVLRVVDNVFKAPDLNTAVGGGEIHHLSFREGQAGCVELWPLFETPKSDQRDFWDPPVTLGQHESGASQLASHIAEKIKNWLDRSEMLEGHNRPIQAGDIMILVKSRTAIVEQMVRALKSTNVPVSGADRMILDEQLAVQDLFAMARFCLLPDDDLTLASVLKSPFLGWDEDELFSLGYNRRGSLWQEICNFDDGKLNVIADHPAPIMKVSDDKREAARDYLSRLMGRVRYLGVYEFFSHILNKACPADDVSGHRAVRKRLGADAQDPIEELLNAAILFGREHIDNMEMFLDHQAQNKIEIKREMDEGGGQVRIMTIHGSKGLQAPIVIMPDTILSGSAKKGGRLLWPHKTKLPVPLYSPRKDDDPKVYKDVHNEAQALDDQEYYRLLYVAMTRAADRLYVAGYKGTKGAKDESWYYKIRQAMEHDDLCQTLDDGTLRIENKQLAEVKGGDDAPEGLEDIAPLPAWAYKQAPDEPFPPRPLIPSRPSEEDMAPALSPLKSMDGNRFRRGNVTHKLLQFLPDFKDDMRKNAALKFVQKNAADLSDKVCNSIVDEVMKIIEHPDYAPFFKAGSMAEVSVTGLMQDNRIISGQIDRLLIEDNDIWIVDYKTNRPPPKDVKDIPPIYHKQMAAYRDSIAVIYPNRKIHCALLWTDGPDLMIIGQ